MALSPAAHPDAHLRLQRQRRDAAGARQHGRVNAAERARDELWQQGWTTGDNSVGGAQVCIVAVAHRQISRAARAHHHHPLPEPEPELSTARGRIQSRRRHKHQGRRLLFC